MNTVRRVSQDDEIGSGQLPGQSGGTGMFRNRSTRVAPRSSGNEFTNAQKPMSSGNEFTNAQKPNSAAYARAMGRYK